MRKPKMSKLPPEVNYEEKIRQFSKEEIDNKFQDLRKVHEVLLYAYDKEKTEKRQIMMFNRFVKSFGPSSSLKDVIFGTYDANEGENYIMFYPKGDVEPIPYEGKISVLGLASYFNNKLKMRVSTFRPRKNGEL